MKLKVYQYEKCGTCHKAMRYLTDRNIACESIPIREQPPSKTELKTMLRHYNGDIRRLFNTSGKDYKAMKLSVKLPSLTAQAAIDLLAENGNLVKRPFVLTKQGGCVGFKEDEWNELLS